MVQKHSLSLSLVALVFALFSLTGCSTKIPVNKEVGQANFVNPQIPQEPMTKHSIAVVSPAFEGAVVQAVAAGNQNRTPQQQYMDRMMMSGVVIAYNPNSHFSENYRSRLKTTTEQTFMEILTKKGFTTKGPYKTFDDMAYGDKKSTYLAVIPVLNLSIDKKMTSEKREKLYYNEEGVIMVSGELYLKVIEPLTQQAMINKRINLSDFGIQKPYIYQYQHNEGGNGGMMASAIEKAGAPKELKDNTDKAMAEAVSEFYAKAVEKINAYLSREELLSLEDEIANLKGLKRF